MVETMIFIRPEAWTRLREDVLSRAPEEACGILLGKHDLVREAYPCRNVHDGDRRRFYALAPEDQFACARYARSIGLDWVAYYHSHPNGATAFSPEDQARAIPGSRHVVIAVRRGEILPPRAWRVDVPPVSRVRGNN
jgi:proteasome lid subunit RPN8/RPN11